MALERLKVAAAPAVDGLVSQVFPAIVIHTLPFRLSAMGRAYTVFVTGSGNDEECMHDLLSTHHQGRVVSGDLGRTTACCTLAFLVYLVAPPAQLAPALAARAVPSLCVCARLSCAKLLLSCLKLPLLWFYSVSCNSACMC